MPEKKSFIALTPGHFKPVGSGQFVVLRSVSKTFRQMHLAVVAK